MPELRFVTVDVFTTTRFAGNPLAVVRVPQGHEISTEQMQIIAREFNLSETVFIFESDANNNINTTVPEWRLRIFLTNGEVPFAGHPTIGAACYALGTLAGNAPKGRLICNAGPMDVDFVKGVAVASIPHNVRVHTQYPFTLEEVYTLQPTLQGASMTPKAINVVSPVQGMNFICVELPSLEALATVQCTGVPPKPRLDDQWVTGKPYGFAGSVWYVVPTPPLSEAKDGVIDVKIRMRMIEGTFEDPATGSAACGLASFLAMKWKTARKWRFAVTQAVEMGRQSDIGVVVELKDGLDAVKSVELSGSSVKVMEGVLDYD